jgi:hypothetical protein
LYEPPQGVAHEADADCDEQELTEWSIANLLQSALESGICPRAPIAVCTARTPISV